MTEVRLACPRCGYRARAGATRCAGCRADLHTGASLARDGAGARRTRLLAVGAGLGVLATMGVAVWSSRPPGATRAVPEAPRAEVSRSAAAVPDVARGSEVARAHPGAWALRTVAQVQVGGVPGAVVFAGVPEHVWVATGTGQSVVEIDPASGVVLSTLPAGQLTEALAVVHGRWLIAWHYWMSSALTVWDLAQPDRPRQSLPIGRNLADVLALPDGESMLVSACQSHTVKRVHLPDLRVTGAVTFPRAVGRMIPVQSHGRFSAAVMGGVFRIWWSGRGSTPIGAWVDLIDPGETPFAATRRSISAGRQPRDPDVAFGGTRLIFPDRVSNQVTSVDLEGSTPPQTIGVGVRPERVVVLPGDRYALSLDAVSRSLTVMGLQPLAYETTLPLEAAPTSAAVSPVRGYAAISLGGARGDGEGVVLVAGTPPRIVARGTTGRGPLDVAASADGSTLATADRGGTVTLLRAE